MDQETEKEFARHRKAMLVIYLLGVWGFVALAMSKGCMSERLDKQDQRIHQVELRCPE